MNSVSFYFKIMYNKVGETMKEKLFKNKYIKNFYEILMIPEIRILPGSLAFFLVMSVVPMLTLIAALCSKFSLSTADITNFFSSILPTGVEEMLLSIFSGVDSSKVNLWFIALGFFLASNGPHAIILVSNALYKIPNKNYLNRRIKALFLTIILMNLVLFILVVLGFGNIILKFILGLNIFSKVSDTIYNSFIILKWPVAIIIIFFLIKVIYTIAPDKKISSKYVNKGAIFATITLILSTAIYSYYANNIADYSYMYGNLANVMVLMLLVYVISYILILGIAINANIYNIDSVNKIED